MKDRNPSIPPNFDRLPEDLRVVISEEVYFTQLNRSHGLPPSSPLLKSREKIR